MSLTVLQLCADKGIAPGATKGAAQHLRGIADGLTAQGHHVVTYTARRPDGPFPVEVRDIATLTDIEVAGADVVYERYSLGHTRGLELARRAGVMFVLEVNSPLVDEASAHRPDTVQDHHVVAERELLAEADLVVAVSSDLARWVSRHRDGPTEVVSNGFEPTWFSGDITAKTHDLVFLGHPKPWHGADRLPGLLKGLESFGHHASLLVVGGGPGADDLERAAKAAGLAERVTITGAMSPQNASAMVRRGRIGLAPYPPITPFYFCPLKVVDYMAAGLPVVATAQGDIPEIVGSGGLLSDPADDDAMVAAIATLLEDRRLAVELGARGWARAHRDMTWNQVARRTLEAIDNVVHKHSMTSCGANR